MSEIQLINTLSKIIVFLLIFFAFFLLTVKSNKKMPNYLFAIFLLLVAFDISGVFLNEWFTEHPFIENLRLSAVLLQMPVLYFYVLSVCYANLSFQPKYLFHSIAFLFFLFLFSAGPHFSKTLFYFQLVSEIQYLFYMAISFLALHKYKKIYEENYTNPANLNYKWLVQMLAVLLVAHFFALSKSVIRFANNENLLLLASTVVMVSALLVTSYFVMKALYQPQIFRGIDREIQPVSTYLKEETQEVQIAEKEAETEPAEKSPDVLAKINTLQLFMTEKEPFLDADLTIQKLAAQTGFLQKELSSLINHHIGKHFFDFINEYRVQKAMEILQDPKRKEVTVLEILYEVGFNSKSSFNTAFKKHTKLTPVAFRKQTKPTT